MKARLLALAICFMLAFPLLSAGDGSQSANFSTIYAGHTVPGQFCSPCCPEGPCYCDPGEQPEFPIFCEGSSQMNVQGNSPPNADYGSLALLAILALSLGLRLWP